MTNDELASLEPVIAEAWDRWDQGRRIRYDHPQDGFPPGGVPAPTTPYPPPYAPGAADDFRGRFQRVMSVPAPFRAGYTADGAPPGESTPSDASGSGSANGAPADAIDPHLGAKEGEGMKSEA
ncbi:hypothetical protein B0H10DRAFT_1786529 [Mycena sp. CBHHK59/15]|nr:hypothetical protein B0H10DRAFT_1786529 [Mycena sp. CBHHK59/15]